MNHSEELKNKKVSEQVHKEKIIISTDGDIILWHIYDRSQLTSYKFVITKQLSHQQFI